MHTTPHNIYIHTQLAKISFDEIFDLTAGVYFNFYNIYVCVWLESLVSVFAVMIVV